MGAGGMIGYDRTPVILRFKAASTLTIDAGGAVTKTQSNHIIDTFGAAASDDLDTINGGIVGDWLILRPANDARTVAVKNGTGNILLSGADFTMDNTRDRLVLLFDSANWIEISRCDGGV